VLASGRLFARTKVGQLKRQAIYKKALAFFRAMERIRVMATPRFFADPRSPAAYYHCVSRVVDRRFILQDEEREHFVRLLRAYESFCQVRVVTYCVMSNHFHVLVEVNPRPTDQAFSDEWVLKQASAIYSKLSMRMLRQTLEGWRKGGNDKAAENLKEQYLRRMWDVSQFMKELKQRFSLWYNKRAERKGTLWEERFSSVLVEGAGTALAVMSAYIDLNPVRAKIVEDPKDYRWCGYAECVSGGRRALAGLGPVMESCCQREGLKPAKMLEAYRLWLYGRGGERRDMAGGEVVRPGISPEAVKQTQARKGKLSLGEMLQCRVRYFTQGAVLGSQTFVDEFFNLRRERFGARRKDGARPMRGADFGGLFALRDLHDAVKHEQ
jgi:REP element-mobilizing transposase RayT